MSLSSETVKEISGLAVTAAAVNVKGLEHADFNAVVIPERVKIQTLESLQQYRNRFAGCMSTNHVDDFVAYSLDSKSKGVKCFVSPEKMIAETIFNIGDEESAGHADNNAILRLKRTADFLAVLSIDGEKSSQKEIAEFIEDWRENIKALDGEGNSLDIKAAINSIRKMTIQSSRKAEHDVADMSASRSVLENVEAKGQNSDLPTFFTFECVPYHGLTSRQFVLRLSVLTGDNDPTLILRIVRVDSALEEITEEFKELLIAKFKESNVDTFIGEFSIK